MELREKEKEQRKSANKANEKRSLVDSFEPDRKKLKMVNTKEAAPENDDEGATESQDKGETEIDACQHIENSEKFDEYVMDAATEEQVKQQQRASNEQEKEKSGEDESMDIDLHEDPEENETEESQKQNPEKVKGKNKEGEREKSKGGTHIDDTEMETNAEEIEGELIETCRVGRGTETTFHTNLKVLDESIPTTKDINERRREVENMMDQWTRQGPTTEESSSAWNQLCSVTEPSARDLSEKLRLVLEPTQATRLKGDYRTGRRINMRKIIPYIASQFRKDKIWMRRTKPSKRDYQIVLALDDSSSMADNHSKELAFESLALISKAMTYLEVGELCVLSFGEDTKVLHPLGEQFNEQSGAR